MENRAFRAIASGLVLVCIGVGAACLGFDRWGRREHDIGKDVDALRADLELVRKASRRSGPHTGPRGNEAPPPLIRESEEQPRSSVVPTASAQQPPSTPPLTPDEADYRAGVVIKATEKVLSDSYANETQDPDWSSPAAETLRAAYHGEGFEGVTTDVACRSTLCRVNFRYEEGPNAELNWRNILHRMPWPGAGTATFNRETRSGSFFLAREGYDLPSVDVNKLDY